MGMVGAENRQYGPLRPRNVSVPSYRPSQKEGCTGCVRQLVSGSGKGQHTSTTAVFSWLWNDEGVESRHESLLR